MKIEIDDEFEDQIVGAALVETYVSVKRDLKAYKKGKGDPCHPDDIVLWEELLPALEIVGNWYNHDFKGKVKRYEKDGS